MKLRNKKTNEIREVRIVGEHLQLLSDAIGWVDYDDLADLTKWWERYEEPKEFWFVDSGGEVEEATYLTENDKANLENFGNYFETKEDAEKAVEKLKAWKRLKEKSFKFYGWNKGRLLKGTPNNITFACDDTRRWAWEDIQDDLDILFGGEE